MRALLQIAGIMLALPAGLGAVAHAQDAPPSFAAHPVDAVRYAGEAHTFSARLESEHEAAQFQWFRDDAPVRGGEAGALTLDPVLPGHAGTYRCEAATAAGQRVTSNTARLEVVEHLCVTVQPVGGTFYAGQPWRIETAVSGGKRPLVFVWECDGVEAGQGAALEFEGHADRSGLYACRVTDANAETVATRSVRCDFVAPAVLEHPAGARCVAGGRHTLEIKAAPGIGQVHYQWRKDGANLPGAVFRRLELGPVGPEDAGVYECVATDDGTAALTSDPATIEVLWFNQQPGDAVCAPGEAHTFEAALSGAPGAVAEYRWFKDEQQLDAAAQQQLTLNPLTPRDQGVYHCEALVDNVVAVSAPAVLQVSRHPILFDAQPAGGTHYAGDPFTASAAVSGGQPPFAFQWYRNGAAISGAETPRLAIEALALGDAGEYVCLVRDTAQAVRSRPARIRVVERPYVAAQPASGSRYVGQAYTFEVQVQGGKKPLSYQWLHDGVKIPGATRPVLTINPLAASHAGRYACEIADADTGRAASEAARLEVRPRLSIVEHPAGGLFYTGDGHVLTVAARGGLGALTHMWRKNGAALPDATQAVLRLETLTPADAGSYLCVVADGNTGYAVSERVMVHVAERIAVTAPPRGGEHYVGAAHVFEAGCTGGRGALRYQWRRDGAPVDGAEGARLMLTDLAVADAGLYTCVIADEGADSVTTAPARLVVTEHVTLHEAPESRNAYVGDEVVLAVSASGGRGALAYQWLKNGQPVQGASAASYALGPVDHDDTGVFRCVVRDEGGDEAVTPEALLSVFDHLRIETQPQGGRYYEGASHAFVCEAAQGIVTQQYQWLKNGEELPGVTSSTYVIETLTPAHAGVYQCVVRDKGADQLASDEAALQVARRLAIVTQPRSGSFYAGGRHTLTVEAEGGQGALRYQWRRDGAPLADATGSALELAGLEMEDAGVYTCVVTDEGQEQVVSAEAPLSVAAPLVITAHPQGAAKYVGGRHVFKAAASGGAGALTYRWRRGGRTLPKAAGASLVLDPLETAHGGTYVCVVRDEGGGEVRTQPAQLTVAEHVRIATPPADVQCYPGDALILEVEAAGGIERLYFQWQQDGLDIPGATRSALVIDPAAAIHSGTYTCVVRDAGGDRVAAGPAQVRVAQ